MDRSVLPDLDMFCAVARHRSFRAAAAEKEVSVSLVSKTIRRLEEELGVTLLTRTTRSVRPTAAGNDLLAQLEPSLATIKGALERLNQHRGSPLGTLKINAPAPIAQFLLAGLAARFTALHPGVSMEITADAAMADIVRDGYDAGVRITKDLQQDMIAVRIGPPQRYAVVGSPAYFRRRPVPQSPRDLAGHDCIRRRFPAGGLQEWAFQRRNAAPEMPTARLIVNDAQIAVNAAAAGGGLAYVHEKYVERELTDGDLVRVLQAWSPGIGAPYLYYPRQRFLSAALRAFVDFARSSAAERQ
ncbi:MAG: LysR substrate-binding domain-containing protein [Rhodocyclaceae bacterium]|nr:LysR substrate-binding domain-containing protein [Pseudomonadota bacterium]MDQ7971863.1 LysR substrate-binding domain-containing protein [Rhodocyclaceae bacterium]MDQ7999770.1 LysR substrate-binding domain-containing protein [Pseudomonadota bacterium]